MMSLDLRSQQLETEPVEASTRCVLVSTELIENDSLFFRIFVKVQT